MDRCEGCGFEYDLGKSATAAAAIVQRATDLVSILEGAGADLTTRRDPQTWSPLEYGCHVRDVLLVQRERVLVARTLDRPSFHPMGRDERVHYDGYAEQRVIDVSRQLRDASRLLSNVLARVGPEDWDRTLIYNYPERVERSLRWVAVHTLHEVCHHTSDVRHQLG
ncbi:MAG: DinB family protein [Acidimicrobiales bacterium]